MSAGPRLVVVLLALCSAVVAGLAGCSSSAPSAPPDLAAASVPTGPPSSEALAAVVAAAKSTLRERAQVSVRLAASQALGIAGRDVTGSGLFDLGTGRGRVDLGQVTGPERVLFLPQAVFVAQAGGASVLPKGKVWISAGLTEQSVATNFPQFVTQVESLNPSLLLSELEWGSSSAAPLAPVGGESAYSVVVDLAKAQAGAASSSGSAGAVAAAGPSSSAPAFDRAISYQITEQSGGSSPTLTAEVVVDHQGRVVGARGTPPGAGIGTVTLSLSGWGASVSVVEPPRSQVVDISSLAPGGERENAAGGDSDGA
ncbi:MAG: hypothetical protein ACRDZ8_02025 [Acidimicrobiales bacterium]